MILNEQIYKNLYRPYFKGMMRDYDKKQAYFSNVSFFTTDIFYAFFYAKQEGTVQSYYLKNAVNIFNAKCKTDFYKLHKYINDNYLPYSFDDLNRLKDSDWTFVLGGDDKRNDLIEIIRKLEYDGFFNYEYDSLSKKELIELFGLSVEMPIVDNNPAVCVFNEKMFIPAKKYFIDDLKENKDIVNFKEKEMLNAASLYHLLVKNLGEDAAQKSLMNNANKYLTLTKSDMLKIINKKIDENRIKFFNHLIENTCRPGMDLWKNA